MQFPTPRFKVQAYYPNIEPNAQPDWYTLRQTLTEDEARAYVTGYGKSPDIIKSGTRGRPTKLRVLDSEAGSAFNYIELVTSLQQQVDEILNRFDVPIPIPTCVRALLKASPQLLELCESLSSALDTVLLHHGQLMQPADQQSRRALVTQAEKLLKTLEPERP